MSARLTRKRARFEHQRDGTGQRDKEFWYEDGNIILVARDFEFRVFKGILADHSPVFKDMFSLPQPSESATAPCPVVDVTDTPEDLRHLLRVYMLKSGSSPFVPEDPSFDMISATIRLGYKYQVSNLVQHSVNYLKMYYTRDFQVFSKRRPSYWPPSFRAEHAIGVVNLARLIGEHTLLPVAFLICCTLGKDIVKGFKREDGSWEQLTLDDIGICFEAKGRLVGRRADASNVVFNFQLMTSCEKPKRCPTELRRVLDTAASAWAVPDPFDSILLQFSKDIRASLCPSCWETVQKIDDIERSEMWKHLPGFFGLPIAEYTDREAE
ncbi:hypothetical protein L226DRAFT_546843 [Lentinus tigrinus ALCF2SS1-7]|uniref:uncharacterized protein n=1 Tax=Lentinus tigrinus ALCF2SS1-7 TaxID=1328758 RepID=UPI0011663461|nr:hypothetical protein L226DRAFT_546843 [Lentinus tigrinus ALCF2SS1-7]